jgi:hypothetical protein
LIERACRWIGAQEFHRRGIVDGGAREQAADRIAALHALLAPVMIFRRSGERDCGDRQRA